MHRALNAAHNLLSQAESYIGIPAEAPRVIISRGNRQSILEGLSFHMPGSKSARIKLTCARMLVHLGITRHLKVFSLPGPRSPVPAPFPIGSPTISTIASII